MLNFTGRSTCTRIPRRSGNPRPSRDGLVAGHGMSFQRLKERARASAQAAGGQIAKASANAKEMYASAGIISPKIGGLASAAKKSLRGLSLIHI